VPIEWYVRDVTLASLPVTLPIIAAVGYLGVFSTALAWYCWYKGIEFVDTGRVAVFFFAQPVVGAVLGVVFLEETVGAGFVLGATLMAVGIYLVYADRSGGIE